MFFKNEANVYQCSPLLQFEWIEHGFGTRHSASWPMGKLRASVRQIHSDICLPADGIDGCAGTGDALIASARGQWICVQTADCLPLLMVSEHNRAVASVHAGWRGTVRKIAAKTVGKLMERFGSAPDEILVSIGPGIGPCCYEVGPEVIEQLRDVLPELPSSGHARLDLVEANIRLLIDVGVRRDRIFAGAPCTFCTPDEFFSYRRGREEGGRMISAIRIRPEKGPREEASGGHRKRARD